MIHAGLKKTLVAGIVAIVGLSLCAVQANAGWWWGAPPAYSSGWDCCGTTAYVPYYSGWSVAAVTTGLVAWAAAAAGLAAATLVGLPFPAVARRSQLGGPR